MTLLHTQCGYIPNTSFPSPMILLSLILIIYMLYYPMRFPGGPAVKNLPADARDVGPVSGLGRAAGGGNGSSLQ